MDGLTSSPGIQTGSYLYYPDHELDRLAGAVTDQPELIRNGSSGAGQAILLDRLFPDAPAGDPIRVLLWSTGGAGLPGHARITSWVMKAAIG